MLVLYYAGPEEAILEWSGRGEACEAHPCLGGVGVLPQENLYPLRLLLGAIYQLVWKA